MKEKITAGYSMRRTETLSVLFLVSSVRMSAQSASPQKPPQPTGDTVTVMLPGTPTPPRQDTTAPEGKPEWRRAGETVPSVGASETRKPSAPAPLGGEIASVQEQIRSAEEDDSRYSGGLVKSLIGARIAILKQTEAMLRQASTAPRQAMDASTLNRLRSVEKEASDNLGRISAQEGETARYSGGLIRATSLATLATLQETQAMIDQRRLVLKYGLRPEVGAQPRSDPPAAPRIDSGTPSDQKDWRIVSIDARVTEANTVWSRYAWKLTLANDSGKSQLFRGTIEFQDSDGFIVDTSNAGNMVVSAQSEREFTGYALIRAEVVGEGGARRGQGWSRQVSRFNPHRCAQ